jgi:hypothetical protein
LGFSFNCPEAFFVSVYKEKVMVGEVERNVWKIDTEIPRFSENREFIGELV